MLIVTVWFIVNDYIDYALGMHPFVESSLLVWAAFFALFSSAIIPFALAVLFSSKETSVITSVSSPTSHKEVKRKGKWAK